MKLFSHRHDNATKRAITTVLIVEDEPLVAFDNEHALAQAGYAVAATVDRYEQAVEVMAEGHIDLVICDVNLAGERDGLDVARHAGSLGIAVLFCTGACPSTAMALGVGCMAKPFNPRDLVRAIGVVEARMNGAIPGALPPGLTLFPTPV